MLMNNLDPEVAENPDALVVYGGTGRAARSWEAFDAIVRELRRLADDETLLVQSGKPVAVFRTHEWAPRVLIANSNLVGRWATWEHFRELERQGLMMYGQMTAGSWIYIGTQGILQGTFETFAELARQHFGGTLRGRVTLTAGLGGMGGAQPLAVTMNDGVCLAIEVDESRAARRQEIGYVDRLTHSPDEALAMARSAAADGVALSIALVGNAAEIEPAWARAGERFDVVTDQTSAHDALGGYVPSEISLDDAARAPRAPSPTSTRRASTALDGRPRPRDPRVPGGRCRGLRLRQQPPGPGPGGGRRERVRLPGVRAGVHPAAVLRGPRPVPVGRALGRPGGHRPHRSRGARAVPRRRRPAALDRDGPGARPVPGPAGPHLLAGLRRARQGGARVQPARRGRARSARRSSSGATTSTPARSPRPTARPRRWRDGSDAVADWPLLNALVNTAAGATWVSIHHGGGVGIGYSQHAGMVCRRRRHRAGGAEARAGAHDGPGHGRRAPRGRRLRARDRRRPRARHPHPDARRAG